MVPFSCYIVIPTITVINPNTPTAETVTKDYKDRKNILC